jgi:uncharacterized membrane protein
MVARAPQRGQAIPVVLLLLACALATCGVLVRIAGLVVEREHTSHVADAAALAGALGGEAAASRIARANHAELTGFEQSGDTVTVRVRTGRFSVTARAARVVEEDTG